MKFEFNHLNAHLLTKLENLLTNLQNMGYKFVPYFGLRSLEDQAKLWRQSRTTAQINKQINEWRSNGAFFLADILENVGPQNGKHATNALPGYSWHNWGKAVDCYYELDGKPCWDGEHPAYKIYADQALLLGLTAGYYFKSFKDPGHIQLNSFEVPQVYSLQEINSYFENKYGLSKK